MTFLFAMQTLPAVHPDLMVTLHFKNMARYDGPNPLSGGIVTVWNGEIREKQHELARFRIDNSTRPQSISSTRGSSLIVVFQPPDVPYPYEPHIAPTLSFAMEAILGTGEPIWITLGGSFQTTPK